MEPKAIRWRAPLVVFAAAAALGTVAYVTNRHQPPGPLPPAATTAVAPEAAAPAPAPPPAAPSGASAQPDAVAVPEPAPAGAAPTFDLVRVDPDGSAVVAGTAAPGAEVTIYADSAPLAHATADADGNFVALFKAEPSGAPQALTLGAGDRRSDETVMLLPKAPPAPGAETGGEPAAVPATASAPTSSTARPAAAEPAEIAATAIIGPDSVEVMPAPGSGGGIALGSISYAETGDVTLAGIGTAGSAVRAYVDGRLAREAAVGDDGRWSLSLDDVAAGLYTLRIDQLAPDGKVASRVETPFQRDFPRAPPPRPGEEAVGKVPPGGSVTVQPGNNLWTLARLHYGSGVLYTQIFTANRELIRDPDRIYPGQIFAMPEVAPTGTNRIGDDPPLHRTE